MTYDDHIECDKEFQEAKDKIEQLQAENKQLKNLLKTAICPNAMNGCRDGRMPNPYGEIEQCQWCYERDQALTAGTKG